MMATVMGAVLHAQVRLIPFMRLLRQYLLQDTAFGPDVSSVTGCCLFTLALSLMVFQYPRRCLQHIQNNKFSPFTIQCRN